MGWATSSAPRCSHGAGTISPPRSPPTGKGQPAERFWSFGGLLATYLLLLIALLLVIAWERHFSAASRQRSGP